MHDRIQSSVSTFFFQSYRSMYFKAQMVRRDIRFYGLRAAVCYTTPACIVIGPADVVTANEQQWHDGNTTAGRKITGVAVFERGMQHVELSREIFIRTSLNYRVTSRCPNVIVNPSDIYINAEAKLFKKAINSCISRIYFGGTTLLRSCHSYHIRQASPNC